MKPLSKRFCRPFVLAIIALAMPVSVAYARSLGATPQEIAASKAHLAMLQAGQYAQLDKEMNKIQKDYETSKIDDVALVQNFGFTETIDPSLEDKFQAWVAAYPNSYAAHHALAQYYAELAWSARGDQTVDKTAEQNFKDMKHFTDLSMKADQDAVKLSPKPLLTYLLAVQFAKLYGSLDKANEILADADAIDPHNYYVRYEYMSDLQSRWNGNLDMMQKYRKTLDTSGLPKDELRPFDDMITSEQIWRAYIEQENYVRIGQFQTGL